MLGVERFDFDTLDSTQVWMHQMWPKLPRDRMTVVVAREQSHGRGRFKERQWVSPRGNLYLTLTLFLDAHRQDYVHLGQVAALAVRQAAISQGISGRNLQLKWPNDLLIDVTMQPKKVGGILVETFLSPPHLVCCVGVGLNIEVAPILGQQQRLQPVSTLFLAEENAELMESRYKTVTDAVIEGLVRHFNLFIVEGFFPFLYAYAAALVHKVGERLVSTQGEKTIEGRFLGLDASGALLLEVDGRTRTFVAGEWLERPGVS